MASKKNSAAGTITVTPQANGKPIEAKPTNVADLLGPATPVVISPDFGKDVQAAAPPAAVPATPVEIQAAVPVEAPAQTAPEPPAFAGDNDWRIQRAAKQGRFVAGSKLYAGLWKPVGAALKKAGIKANVDAWQMPDGTQRVDFFVFNRDMTGTKTEVATTIAQTLGASKILIDTVASTAGLSGQVFLPADTLKA